MEKSGKYDKERSKEWLVNMEPITQIASGHRLIFNENSIRKQGIIESNYFNPLLHRYSF